MNGLALKAPHEITPVQNASIEAEEQDSIKVYEESVSIFENTYL